ncbi:DUF3304 domain-containing protein [Ralstonia sp.]|uniref:DUF3304 domain-containing protein n=1 Tax=Ralstonia sp. TaxID=54061 RepID=UPI0031D8D759
MNRRMGRVWLAAWGLALMLTACRTTLAEEPMFGVELTGIDHLADHLSVSNFSLNGTGGAQAGSGGRTVCCARVPAKWYPGLTAHVKWTVIDWRDGKEGGKHEADVPIDPYTKDGHAWVHFLADGSVRVVITDFYPEGKSYPGPHDPIPQKEPWYRYPVRKERRDSADERYIDRDIAKKSCESAKDPTTCEDADEKRNLDDQWADARRWLPACGAPGLRGVSDCVRQAEWHMQVARWRRRCKQSELASALDAELAADFKKQCATVQGIPTDQ